MKIDIYFKGVEFQSTEAAKTEYTDLLQELESIGYDDLLILNNYGTIL